MDQRGALQVTNEPIAGPKRIQKWLAVATGGDSVRLMPMDGRGPDFFVKLADYEHLDAALNGSNGWETNARFLLDHCPHAVRVREGGGPEDLLSSLVVTFQKMQGHLASAQQPAQPCAITEHSGIDCGDPTCLVNVDGQPSAQPGGDTVLISQHDMRETIALALCDHKELREQALENLTAYIDRLQSALTAAKGYADDLEARYHGVRAQLTAAQQRIAELEATERGLRNFIHNHCND